MTATPIEHGHSRLGSGLRARRFRLVLWVVLVEGVLVLFHVIPWWAVLLVATAAFVAYFAVGRSHPSQAVRQGSWIGAVSQLVVVLVPLLAFVVTALAVVVLVIVAVVALGLLLLDRR